MRIAILSFLTLVTTCRLQKATSDNVVARVNDHYLYQSELTDKLGESLSSADSASIIQNYINTWAKEPVSYTHLTLPTKA